MENSRKILRGIIHCHSRHSYDSLTGVKTYLRFAHRHQLDFIVLTDHDTTKGSVELSKAAAKAMPNLQVPIAAEYLTDQGDVVAVFINSEINSRQFNQFTDEVRAQGGLILFPHPFVGHKNIPAIAEACDLIETFNSRASQKCNLAAESLAAEYERPVYGASDAHLARSLGRVILEVENLGDLRTSLLKGRIVFRPAATPRLEVWLSQQIKAIKKRDLLLGLSLFIGIARYFFRRIVALFGPAKGE